MIQTHEVKEYLRIPYAEDDAFISRIINAGYNYLANAVENYAGACQNVTTAHRHAVEALTTVKKVEAYDYTTGYPQKINFDTYFNAE